MKTIECALLNEINICFSSDNNYAQHMAVTMASILSNASNEDNYNFYVLDGGISQKDKEKIEKLKSIKDFSISYFNVDKNDFSDCPMTGYVKYITLPTYYRFKIPSLLKNVDKVLYLDCDLVLNADIKELYSTDIEDYYLAAIPEAYNNLHRERMDISAREYYCNAGVLLINNKKWREDKIEEKLFEYAQNPKMKVIYQDQDIINAVLMYRIKYMPLKWNLQHVAIDYDDSFPYHKMERFAALNNPSLIHYSHKDKPWGVLCDNKFKHLYYQYLQLTPYKKEISSIKFRQFCHNFFTSIFSVKKEPTCKTTMFLGIKIKRRNKHGILMQELKSIKESIKESIGRIDHPIYCINNGVNTIFRYMTGLQLTKDYQTERVVVFDPLDAPIDHFQRYSFVQKYIKSTDKVLDIACGVGYGTALMAQKAAFAVGVDINKPSINFANNIFQKDNLKYICSDANTFEWQEKFDKVISFETIEHIEEDELFLSKLKDCMKDEGTLICSVPNETIFPFNPKITPFHIKHYTVESLNQLLISNGFKIEEIYFQYENEDHSVGQKEEEGYTIICIAKKTTTLLHDMK